MNSIERKMAEITADLEKNQRMIGLFKEAIQAISNGNTNQLKALQVCVTCTVRAPALISQALFWWPSIRQALWNQTVCK